MWIRAETEFSLYESFLKIAETIKLRVTDDSGKFGSLKKLAEDVNSWIKHQGKVLYVFDNSPDYESLVDVLPTVTNSSDGIHVIVTTESAVWPSSVFNVIELKPFNETESENFIKHFLRFDIVKIRSLLLAEVISIMDGHLLGLRQFAIACNETLLEVNCFVESFIEQLNTDCRSLGTNDSSVVLKPVLGAILTSIRRVTEKDELSGHVLNVLAHLAGEEICVDLLCRIFSANGRHHVDMATQLLVSYSLLKRFGGNGEKCSISIHSLVQVRRT